MAGATRLAIVDAIFAEAAQQHEAARRAGFETLVAVADEIANAFARGRKVLLFGNGGSAADAQHFAAELAVRFERERRAVPALALTTDTSIVTAVGNDYGFDRVFARQVEAFGVEGDVAIGISTSGASANVRLGLEEARARRLVTVAMTGRDGGPVGRVVTLHLNVPHASTARVQEVQRTQIHAICALVERALEGERSGSGE
jgi:D-sedoheptulose 7-phosphate isomerase